MRERGVIPRTGEVRPKRTFIKSALLGVSLLAITANPGMAQNAPIKDETAQFDIPAQTASVALELYAAQANVELAYPYKLLKDVQAPALTGKFDKIRALELLLEGTGLTHEIIDNGAIVIRDNRDRRTNHGSASPDNRRDGVSLALLEPDSAPYRTNVRASSTAGSRSDAAFMQDEIPSADPALEEIDEIVVTGSLIRGTKASVGSNLVTIDRLDIERGGFGSLPEVIQSLTNNFAGGISEFSRSPDNSGNLSGGTAINLRGLGAGNTLTLVNGRRLAAGGLDGNFVDISNIPASLVERVEVLADGASATYGSDAIGGVVNIIMRDDFEGAETSLRFGTVTEGGTQEYRASQLFGKNWEINNRPGNAVLSYEYYNRGRLRSENKPFARDSDLTSFGGNNFGAQGSVPGNILDPVTFFTTVAFAIPDGQDGTNLTPDELLPGQINLFNRNEGRDLLQDQEQHSFFASVFQKVAESLELFAEARYSDRDFDQRPPQQEITLTVPSTNPYFVDALGGPSEVRVSFNSARDFAERRFGGDTRTFNGVFGGKATLWGDWQGQAYGSYSSERRRTTIENIDPASLAVALADPDPATAFNPFGDGSFKQNPDTVNSIVFENPANGKSEVWSGNMTADGSLFQLPAGALKIAVGANFDSFSLDSFSDNGPFGIRETDFGRDAFAIFGEAYVPLFDGANSRPGLQKLIFTASVRFEDFDDVGSTTNPKFGLLWSPVKGLNIRGTFGTSFRAPDLVELDTTESQTFIFPIPDSSSSTGLTSSIILNGNNGNLESETADSWTLGFDFTPSSLPDLTFNIGYYNVKFEKRIVSALSAGLSILEQEERFASAIIRNPTQAQIDEACAEGTFFDLGSPCRTTPVGAIIDLRPINAGITKTDGLDFNIVYELTTEHWGTFSFDVGGTYILAFKEAFGPTAPVTKILDTVGNPTDFRMRNSVSWTNQKGFSATAFLNFTGSSADNISTPERKIKSWTTIDLTLAYATGNRWQGIGLNDTRFSFNARNLFDDNPPFVNNFNGIAFDPENFSPLGRFLSFNLTKSF